MKKNFLLLLILIPTVAQAVDDDPWFKATNKGWEPQCPAKMTFIHQTEKTTVQTDHPSQPGFILIHEYSCRWQKPMAYKPTQDEFKCIDNKKASKLPICTDKETYK